VRGSTATAQHVDKLASGITRLIRQQPQDGFGDFLWLAAALHRHEALDPFQTAGFAAVGMHVGVDKSRPECIGLYPMRGHFQRQTAHHAVDRALAHRVIDMLVVPIVGAYAQAPARIGDGRRSADATCCARDE